eukprot:scaffold103151_cov72-Phaeocystis_antarctica.AAC.1
MGVTTARVAVGVRQDHLENDAEEEHRCDAWVRVTEAARLSKVIVAVILERRGGAGEQHVD